MPHFGDAAWQLSSYRRRMTTLMRRCARAAAVTALSSTVLLGAAGATQADPPADWTGGSQAEFGRVTWVHNGWYPGAKGNWHVGELMIEEDDDGVTGSIIDWRCPDGVEPPGPLVWPLPPTTCKEKGRTYIWDLEPWDVATYDHATDRLSMSGQFDEVDSNYDVIGTLAIDLTMKGLVHRGSPSSPAPTESRCTTTSSLTTPRPGGASTVTGSAVPRSPRSTPSSGSPSTT